MNSKYDLKIKVNELGQHTTADLLRYANNSGVQYQLNRPGDFIIFQFENLDARNVLINYLTREEQGPHLVPGILQYNAIEESPRFRFILNGIIVGLLNSSNENELRSSLSAHLANELNVNHITMDRMVNNNMVFYIQNKTNAIALSRRGQFVIGGCIIKVYRYGHVSLCPCNKVQSLCTIGCQVQRCNVCSKDHPTANCNATKPSLR